MSIAVVVLLALVLLMQIRFWWIQGEHTVVLDLIQDCVDGVDFDVRDIHEVTGARRSKHREMLRDQRLNEWRRR